MVRDIAALLAFLEARASAPFAWGPNDCVSFAAGAVKAQGGPDILASLPDWDDEASALAALEARGGLVAATDAVLARIPPALAHRGDVGAVAGPRGPLLVVIEGDTLAGPDANGVRRLPRRRLTHAWRAL